MMLKNKLLFYPQLFIYLSFLWWVLAVTVTGTSRSDQRLQLLSPSALQNGDIVLVSLPCYLCRLIEAEEGMPFSHMAMVVFKNNRPFFLESWGIGVKLISWDEFWLRPRTKNSEILWLRYSAINKNSDHVKKTFSHRRLFSRSLYAADLATLIKPYLGLSYDAHFLWNNVDDHHQELMYCSELIFKVMQQWLGQDFRMQPKSMHFYKNRNLWFNYFAGAIPDGKLGIAPSDFAKNADFIRINFK